jgi:hypothetical protein
MTDSGGICTEEVVPLLATGNALFVYVVYFITLSVSQTNSVKNRTPAEYRTGKDLVKVSVA